LTKFNGNLRSYSGKVYEGENESIEEDESNLVFSFSFSRPAVNWNTMLDFNLESDYEQILNLKESFQEIIIPGIKSHQKGEGFEFTPSS